MSKSHALQTADVVPNYSEKSLLGDYLEHHKLCEDMYIREYKRSFSHEYNLFCCEQCRLLMAENYRKIVDLWQIKLACSDIDRIARIDNEIKAIRDSAERHGAIGAIITIGRRCSDAGAEASLAGFGLNSDPPLRNIGSTDGNSLRACKLHQMACEWQEIEITKCASASDTIAQRVLFLARGLGLEGGGGDIKQEMIKRTYGPDGPGLYKSPMVIAPYEDSWGEGLIVLPDWNMNFLLKRRIARSAFSLAVFTKLINRQDLEATVELTKSVCSNSADLHKVKARSAINLNVFTKLIKRQDPEATVERTKSVYNNIAEMYKVKMQPTYMPAVFHEPFPQNALSAMVTGFRDDFVKLFGEIDSTSWNRPILRIPKSSEKSVVAWLRDKDYEIIRDPGVVEAFKDRPAACLIAASRIRNANGFYKAGNIPLQVKIGKRR